MKDIIDPSFIGPRQVDQMSNREREISVAIQHGFYPTGYHADGWPISYRHGRSVIWKINPSADPQRNAWMTAKLDWAVNRDGWDWEKTCKAKNLDPEQVLPGVRYTEHRPAKDMVYAINHCLSSHNHYTVRRFQIELKTITDPDRFNRGIVKDTSLSDEDIQIIETYEEQVARDFRQGSMVFVDRVEVTPAVRAYA